jgi:hypothetical protein
MRLSCQSTNTCLLNRDSAPYFVHCCDLSPTKSANANLFGKGEVESLILSRSTGEQKAVDIAPSFISCTRAMAALSLHEPRAHSFIET